MAEACAEFVIVICTLLMGNLFFLALNIAKSRRLRRVEKMRRRLEGA